MSPSRSRRQPPPDAAPALAPLRPGAPRAAVLGTGRYNPERVLTNAELATMVDTSDEWITTRTGMKERRIAAEHEHTSVLGANAARAALEQAGVDASEVDLIICATVTGDMVFPATACFIQELLGARKATAFDLAAACTGFIYGLEVASQLLEGGVHRYALVIGAEKIGSVTDWTDRNTCVLFGDGAGAVLLGQPREGQVAGPGVLASASGTDGSLAHILNIPVGGTRTPLTPENYGKNLHKLQMSGKEVYRQAVGNMVAACQDAMRKAGLGPGDIKLIVPHQANLRIIDGVAERLKIPTEKVFINVQRYGNTGAAAVAMALDEAHREGRFGRGDKILLVAFGAGLTWGATVIEW